MGARLLLSRVITPKRPNSSHLHCFILAGAGRAGGEICLRTRRRRLAVGKNVKADGQRSLQRVNNATIATRPTDCKQEIRSWPQGEQAPDERFPGRKWTIQNFGGNFWN
jgi:hypothetical protein